MESMSARPRNPDFKNMKLQEIRDNISGLNREITQTVKAEIEAGNRFLAGEGFLLAVALPVTIIFPPAIFAGVMVGAAYGAEAMAETKELQKKRMEQEALREKFKLVWRARPGRRQFDLNARRTREAARRKQPKP
jgi:hypothetical protein